MGGGTLPAALLEGKLYFLFGRENKFEKNAPGWADFGGGRDKGESHFETAIRETTEEFTGFLGATPADIRALLKEHYVVEYHEPPHDLYRTHVFSYPYNPWLPHYYNNNQLFLQKKLKPSLIRGTTIFEKDQIRWIAASELPKMRSQFRFYYRHIVDRLIDQHDEIVAFLQSHAPIKDSFPSSCTRRHRHRRRRRDHTSFSLKVK
jgi:8-oxo-dGTP pyrophosphatase MutT (NUDIX family)